MVQFYGCRYSALEEEAKELNVIDQMSISNQIHKFYPFAIDEVPSVPFVKVGTVLRLFPV